MTTSWSFHCNACGKCCNSPPQMSLPELFHHAHRFIGALGIRRIRRPAGTLQYELLHPGFTAGESITVHGLAIAYPTLSRCPALQDDGHCAVHHDRKPLACSVVPLDALLADTQQHALLAARSAGGAEYIGADCIVPAQPAERAGFRLHADTNGVRDAEAQQAVQAQRAALAADKHWWGDAVFRALARAGLASSLAPDALLTLPLVPVLAELAQLSPACLAACVGYLQAQQALIAQQVAAALTRKHAAERGFTTQLRAMEAANARLLQALQADANGTRHTSNLAAEYWLSLRTHHHAVGIQ